MSLYRKKPVVVEAKQITPERLAAVSTWLDAYGVPHTIHLTDVSIEMEGGETASLGDYVILDQHGEFHACKQGIFEETYEAVAS